MSNISLRIEGDVARLVFDRPDSSANIFDRDTLLELESLIETLEKEQQLKRILVMSAKESIFIAGADIKAIQGVKTRDEAFEISRMGQRIFQRLYLLKAPTVAVVHGACLGGGMELALACKARVATDSPKTKLGLPEVLLGILPGWGGTQRLPKLLRLDGALDLMLTGKQLDGKRAFKAGLVDAVCPVGVQEDVALTLPIPQRPFKLANFLMGRVFKGLILNKARAQVMKETRGNYPAPLRILSVLGSTHARHGDYDIEAAGLADLAMTPVSRQLVQLFINKEAADKGTHWLDKCGGKIPETKRLAVLGAGVMGGGIAHLAAAKGYPILMKDIANPALALGIKSAAEIVGKDVARRRMTEYEGRKIMARIMPVLTFEGFHRVDAVIEAVVENMDVKKKVLAEVEKVMSSVPGVGAQHAAPLLCSNTSSLSITEMAKALQHPEQFIGLHFFNPVSKMPLVEIIRGEKTSDECTARAVALAQKLGKTPVVVKDGPGFLVNRLLAPYMNAAIRLVEEGVSPVLVDEALLQYGMPMGPCHLTDEVGLDTAGKVAHILEAGLGERMKGSALVDKLVEEKFLGRKTGTGFYCYSEEALVAAAQNSGSALPAMAQSRNKGGKDFKALNPRFAGNSKHLDAKTIQDRCLSPLISEAELCLREGVVASKADLNLAMILGTGYAPFRGGPLG
ncbi:MAG: 3-hydroxyacyl-CoA dehydrogenase NAD-binding domain-containing protein [Planctomycetota bacterium]